MNVFLIVLDSKIYILPLLCSFLRNNRNNIPFLVYLVYLTVNFSILHSHSYYLNVGWRKIHFNNAKCHYYVALHIDRNFVHSIHRFCANANANANSRIRELKKRLLLWNNFSEICTNFNLIYCFFTCLHGYYIDN